MELKLADRALPGDQFSKRILQPAADLMAKQLHLARKTLVTVPLEVPPMIHKGAATKARGVNARGTEEYFIGTDSIVTRFDVLSR